LRRITEGVDGEFIGDFGLVYDGAAALELDRFDLNLRTPPHTKIIASSGGHSDNCVPVTEELLYSYAGLTASYDYRIRADMTYFTVPNDGAVFSAGSIAFGRALPVHNFNNNVSRILANVVNAFLRDGVLPGERWISEGKQWR
jgi:N,N-dimethylformamidase